LFEADERFAVGKSLNGARAQPNPDLMSHRTSQIGIATPRKQCEEITHFTILKQTTSCAYFLQRKKHALTAVGGGSRCQRSVTLIFGHPGMFTP
jgi:hypothetical protein